MLKFGCFNDDANVSSSLGKFTSAKDLTVDFTNPSLIQSTKTFIHYLQKVHEPLRLFYIA